MVEGVFKSLKKEELSDVVYLFIHLEIPLDKMNVTYLINIILLKNMSFYMYT